MILSILHKKHSYSRRCHGAHDRSPFLKRELQYTMAVPIGSIIDFFIIFICRYAWFVSSGPEWTVFWTRNQFGRYSTMLDLYSHKVSEIVSYAESELIPIRGWPLQSKSMSKEGHYFGLKRRGFCPACYACSRRTRQCTQKCRIEMKYWEEMCKVGKL